MTKVQTVSQVEPAETSRIHMNRVRQLLVEYLDVAGLSDKMRISAVCPGHISTCNVAPTPQDSWQISLLLGGESKDNSMATLEKFGFRRTDEEIATIRYDFSGDFYSILQAPIGIGAVGHSEYEFTSHADAMTLVMRIIANVNFAEGTSKLVRTDKQKTFRKRWYDFLILQRTIRNERHTGWWAENLAIVNYDGAKIVVPLTKEAKRKTFTYFSKELKAERKLGGFILPDEDCQRHVNELMNACNGYILYLESIHG